MLRYALIFLVVALIAGALGVSGVAAVATQIAYVLFVVAIVLFLVHLLSGRRSWCREPARAASRPGDGRYRASARNAMNIRLPSRSICRTAASSGFSRSTAALRAATDSIGWPLS